MKYWQSEGTGRDFENKLKSCGENVIIEDGVRIFHPERVSIGNNVYIGHDTILKGYYKHDLIIEDNTWIGQMCFIHGAGGVKIGKNVGIGPGVKIHAASHIESTETILFSPLEFKEIIISDGCNIGIGAVILPGVRVGENVKIGANAVVNRSIPDNVTAVGVPAKVIKKRD
ncbi:acyltransferase [Paenibacillus allorhizosphaerae]|uniref:2,3,4,5-tetrahydropyridine-2,6-dicarboxylate N-acetyltransferase n=1 Tax=Paenibacillus allorhizosphaerae TaxID=2849866 RepID=A0ABM8VS67_9BACL|nr:acyltransferase [Paenibacillus allorhizosphaerae]CAG7656184.1 2,3,4,5-tetrahydropyridine-2,6-dicarboxylate N-acetyltransferase [Paenibacillus allorhizosphaerae]